MPKDKILVAGFHFHDGASLFKGLQRMKTTELVNFEKYKKDFAVVNMNIGKMFKWGFLFLILTAALFYIMYSMISIPGVDIATEFFGR